MTRTRGNTAATTVRGRTLGADGLVLLALALWWVVNLITAASLDLANDEAYYWYFSQHLDWGYFDHPPLVALLVWLTSWLPGTFGVRLATTLLQPLYLLLFWRLLRPADASRRDALLYCLLCFSQPLLQLYGFLALPDAPLLMGTVLFLWAYKRFCASISIPNALLLGLTVALLGYSKYHGALVVALVVLSNPKLLLRGQLYFAALVALLLLAPHLWWQYTHDWVSLRYHLLDRNADAYRINYTLEYLALVLVVFNPLWLYHYAKGLRPLCRQDAFGRSLVFLLVGFLLFFLLGTLRGTVQPQWLLPAVFPCVALAFRSGRTGSYVPRVGWACVVLFLVVRVLAVANPLHLKGELWDQRRMYTAIAEVAGERPVVFMHTYTAPPKYTFYTGGEAYCTPYYFNRHSQWQYDTTDRTYTGREVMVCNFTNRQGHCLPLRFGGYRQLFYDYVPDYHPMHELVADIRTLPPVLTPGAEVQTELSVYNPYPYDICSTDSLPVDVLLYFAVRRYIYPGAKVALEDTLRAGDTTRIGCRFTVPTSLPEGVFPTGIAIGQRGLRPSDTGPRKKVRIEY